MGLSDKPSEDKTSSEEEADDAKGGPDQNKGFRNEALDDTACRPHGDEALLNEDVDDAACRSDEDGTFRNEDVDDAVLKINTSRAPEHRHPSLPRPLAAGPVSRGWRHRHPDERVSRKPAPGPG